MSSSTIEKNNNEHFIYKELEPGKLEFHITKLEHHRKKNNEHFNYKELELGMLEYCVASNLNPKP